MALSTTLSYTIQALHDLYLSTVTAQLHDKSIDLSALSDFDAKAWGTAGVGSSLAYDTVNLFNQAIPQYAGEVGVNMQLAVGGVATQYPATPSIMFLTANGLVAAKTYNLPVGTIVTATNGTTYSVISSNPSATEVVLTTVDDTFTVICTITGQGTLQANTSIVTLTPPIVSTDGSSSFSQATVTSSDFNLDGTTGETLAHATNRLITLKGTPLDGTRSTDFYNQVVTGTVTDAVIINSNQTVYTGVVPQNFGIYLASGEPIDDTLLNKGLANNAPKTAEVVYNRDTSPTVCSNTLATLNEQQIIGARPNVRSVATKTLAPENNHPLTTGSPVFKITVTLLNNYDVDTSVQISDPDGTSVLLTIKQLIKRETRRAVCQQNFGAILTQDDATLVYTLSQLATSSIENQLDTALGTAYSSGTLGTFLRSRQVEYNSTPTTTGTYAYTPLILLADNTSSTPLVVPTSTSDPLAWVYDISPTVGEIYDNIAVAG